MATTTAGPNNTYKLVTVLFCLFTDFFVSSTLFFHGKEFSRFKAEILAFEYCTTTIDFWVLAIIRFCLLLGSVIGFARNKREAIHRLSKSTRSIFYLSAALIIYVVVKCLIASECHLEKDKKLWFWCFAGFSILGSGSLTFSWYLLSKYKIPSILSTEEEVGDILERENLLDTELDGEDSKNKHKKKKKRKNAEVEEPSASTWKLLSYSKPDFGYLMLAFLFLLLACGAQIFLPYYTGQVIDGIAIEKDKKKFEMAILYMGLISLGDAICAGLRGGIFTFVCARFNIRINNQLFGSIINQDIGFFDKTKTGEIVSRLTSDTTKMSDQVCLNVNVFLRNIVLGLGVCIFMFKLSWQLTVVTLIGLPLIAFISEVYGNYYKKLSTAVQDCVAKTNEVAAEVVSSMKTVRSFANEDGELKRYKRKNHKVFKWKIKEALALGGYNSCTEVMMLAMEVAILYYGGHLVLKGYLSGGNLVSFILYQLELTNCLEEIGDVYTGLMEAVGAAEKVFKLIEKKPSISNDGKIIPHSCEGSVEFKNVSFSYPGRPDALILNDVSFKVQPGQVVALVGASGGGKSTCINLLEHFYEPSSGEVCIDAVPVKDLDHKYLHTVVSLVGQEPVLFGRSVTKNIAYGIEDLTNDMQKIEYAATLANAHSFIREMPEAYQTETGEKGLQLSGGQKQRIAIARALIRNPKILLLDEATSALDAESEHLVQDAIYRNLQGHTVLIIAHRLSTIEKADLVIVIDKGQVAEKGTHAELIAKDGLYNKLVQRQLLGPDKVGSSSSDPDSDGVRQRAKKRRDSNSSVSSSSSGSSSSSEKGFRGGYSVSPPKL